MKKYLFLMIAVLFVLFSRSLKAQQWMLAPGLIETNAEGAPIIVYGNKIVIFSVGSGVTWNGVTSNIPVLVYDKATNKTYPIKGDASAPVEIQELKKGANDRTFYLVPKDQGSQGHFYEVTIGDDIMAKRINAPYKVESVTLLNGKIIANHCSEWDTARRFISTFDENHALIRTVKPSDESVLLGTIEAYQGQIVATMGRPAGIGLFDPETGTVTRLDNQKVDGLQQVGWFTVKDGKLLYFCAPGSVKWRYGLFEYEPTSKDWRFIDTSTNIPVYDPTFNIWKVYLLEGRVYYGQKASKKGWYQVNDTVITYIEEDYRVNKPVPQPYVEKIFQLYNFGSHIDKVFEVQGTTFGTGPGIIAIWGKPNSVQAIAEKQKLICYPNPATDIINIAGMEFQTPASYAVIDMTGREVLTGETSGSINIDHLPSGIYTIVVYNPTSGIPFTGKVQK